MNSAPPIYKSETKAIEFAVAVIGGGLGAAVISSLRIHPLLSVGFALGVMVFMAVTRWRACSRFKDHESLEAFAEDIYLLGYLLTLAALLGLAPRLMSDEANLFSIAGMKLVTTVVGLGLMMVFRQIARRWAQEEETNGSEKFASQQRQFTEAVSRVNQGADELSAKLGEVMERFDPERLIPVAEWSNRAATAFHDVTKVLEQASPTLKKGIDELSAVEGGLSRVQTASSDLAGVMTTSGVQAAKAMSVEMINTGRAIHGLGGSISCLAPAGDAARVALEGLGNQANLGVAQFNAIHASLNQTAAELSRVEAALAKLAQVNKADVNGPLYKLAEALQHSAAKTAAAAQSVDALKDKLQVVPVTGDQVAQRIEATIGKSHLENQQSVQRLQQQATRAADQLQQVTRQLESVAAASQPSGAFASQLLVKLDGLQEEMRETNQQIRTLVTTIDTGASNDKGILSWLRGGRDSRGEK